MTITALKTVSLLLAPFAIYLSLGLSASAAECKAPYRIKAGDNRCVWSCASGTQPHAASNKCVCKEGLSRKGRDAAGRVVCSRQPERRSERPTNHAQHYPFNTHQRQLCKTYASSRNETRYPYRCKSVSARLSLRKVLQRLEITVRKGHPGSATTNRKGRYRVKFRKPATPRANRDCNATLTSAPNACSRSCFRVEYLPFFENGRLRALRAANGPEAGDCNKSFTSDYDVEMAAKALAYDQCSRVAFRRNIATWNHSITLLLPLRFAAAYAFRDPHTYGSTGNWRYHLQMERKYRETNLALPVRVRCR